MSNFTDFIGGGGSASFPTIFLSKSQTWVPPQDGNICIHVIGGGGGGKGKSTSAGSGAAGGYCKKNSLAVTTSGSFTVVVGAGGAGGSGGYGGGDGGNSTVAGTGLSATLTANGGEGAVTPNGTGNSAGGTASNGDVNNTGGAGGPALFGGFGGAGGGAVGLTGTGQAGNNSTYTPRAGECDIIGDLWSSTMGQIAGGIAGRSIRRTNSTVPYDAVNGGPLSGGGGVLFNTGGQMLVQGGAGGIGGGGGAGVNTEDSDASLGGNGGEGIVVIQYIP